GALAVCRGVLGQERHGRRGEDVSGRAAAPPGTRDVSAQAGSLEIGKRRPVLGRGLVVLLVGALEVGHLWLLDARRSLRRQVIEIRRGEDLVAPFGKRLRALSSQSLV